MPSPEKQWDVFLSYASPDRAQVEKLALYLENDAGLTVFLDKWCLVPGQPFIPELEQAILASRSCAVFVGESGIRPWQNREMQAALNEAVSGAAASGLLAYRVIPVLLPGANEPPKEELPVFLKQQTWVDFRSPLGLDDPDALRRLVAGVRGKPPGKPDTPPRWLTAVTVEEASHPTGLAVSGNVMFVVDHDAGCLLRVEDGAVVKRHGGLAKPHHLIVLGERLIVADTNHHRLAHFDLQLEPCDDPPALQAYRMQRPHGLTTNFPGEFYVTDADNHRILRVHHGEVVATAGRAECESGTGPGEFSVPCGIAASLDCVVVADTYNHRIQVLDRDLLFISSFGQQGYGKGQMAYPVAVATWRDWIVVSDEYNKRLQLWRRESGNLPFEVSCVSADLLGNRLGSPFGICFDEDGKLLVADRRRGGVLRIDFDRLLADLALRDG
jgi:sugar lactone lactonase YvrE